MGGGRYRYVKVGVSGWVGGWGVWVGEYMYVGYMSACSVCASGREVGVWVWVNI